MYTLLGLRIECKGGIGRGNQNSGSLPGWSAAEGWHFMMASGRYSAASVARARSAAEEAGPDRIRAAVSFVHSP